MSKLEHVNTTDIADAIRLGCRTMHSVFNADDNQVPFFSSTVCPTASFGFSALHSEAHVPGRHLNALLNAEDALGVHVDDQAVQNHRHAAFLALNGPVVLPLNRQTIDGVPINFSPHNLREALHALYALTKFRQDPQASHLAERLIHAVLDFWTPTHGWDVHRLDALGIHYQKCQSFLQGEARMLGPLVKYYHTTRYQPALNLAMLLKDKALRECFPPDGAFNQSRCATTHVHSITCVLSSLAQCADLLDDNALIMRVKAFYDHGLWTMRDEIGWSPETLTETDNDYGEANNTGDILETALILARRVHPEYYHDAERILRCHLLPSQLRDISFIINPPNPHDSDALRDVANRHLGAFGFPAPYGHESIGKDAAPISFNMDIVGGAVASLCEAYRDAVRSEKSACWINLLFDREAGPVHVKSPYTHDCLRIKPRQPGPLFVRIPPWLNVDDITVHGFRPFPRPINGYLHFQQPAAGQEIRLHFPLKESEMTLPQHLHVRPIRVRMRGDTVLQMDNFGTDLTFFDSYQSSS